MRSTSLVQLIEGNWEEISRRLIVAVKNHPEMTVLAARPESEIRGWSRDILEDLGGLLTAAKDDEVRKRFEVLGRQRFEERVPLHEAVLRLQLLKDHIIDFVHEQGYAMTALQLYAEEELSQRVGRFFDASIYHIVCGYEKASHVERRLAS